MKNTDKGKRQPIKVYILSYILIVLGIVCATLTIVFSVLTAKDYKAVTSSSQNYLDAEEAANSLQAASDFLTNQARLSVNLKNKDYVIAYCKEVTQTKRREAAIESLTELVGDENPQAMEKLNSAMAESVELSNTEYHAMRLICASLDMAESEVPDPVCDFEISKEEETLPIEEKEENAFELLNNQEYADAKDAIDEDINEALNLIKTDMVSEVNQSEKQFELSSRMLRICIILMAIAFLALGFSLVIYLLRPIQRNIRAIQLDQDMPQSISYEMDYLSRVYNELRERNSSVQSSLRIQAEHDALTGLLNRTAYNELLEFLSDQDEKMAMLMIDLDDFKKINDACGHRVGDLALQRVAELLKRSFRSNDYIVRYGGDEFIVFMCGIEPDQKEIIQNKLEYINLTLLTPDHVEVPPFSISCGIAFSEHGYNKELFERADAALYTTKQHGKGGFTFV